MANGMFIINYASEGVMLPKSNRRQSLAGGLFIGESGRRDSSPGFGRITLDGALLGGILPI
jgi:hypothetical protein